MGKKKKEQSGTRITHIQKHDDEDRADKQLSGRRTNDLINERPFFFNIFNVLLVTSVIFILIFYYMSESVSHLRIYITKVDDDQLIQSLKDLIYSLI